MTDLELDDLAEPAPLAVPDRPDPDDIIASTWGRWVHDRIPATQPVVLQPNADQRIASNGQPVPLFTTHDPHGAVVSGAVKAWGLTAGRYRIDVGIFANVDTGAATRLSIQLGAVWFATDYAEGAPAMIAPAGSIMVPNSVAPGADVLNLNTGITAGRWGSDMTILRAASTVTVTYLGP